MGILTLGHIKGRSKMETICNLQGYSPLVNCRVSRQKPLNIPTITQADLKPKVPQEAEQQIHTLIPMMPQATGAP